MAAATDVCSERHEAVKWKARHHRVEDLEALIGTKPVLAPNGEHTRVRSVAASKVGG